MKTTSKRIGKLIAIFMIAFSVYASGQQTFSIPGGNWQSRINMKGITQFERGVLFPYKFDSFNNYFEVVSWMYFDRYGDSAFHAYDGKRWFKLLSDRDGSKFNESDTAGKWLGTGFASTVFTKTESDGRFYKKTDGGVANGVATLNDEGTLDISQVPSGLVGAVVYKGVWNATTNTPALSTGSGINGNYYIVSVAGSSILDGVSTWAVKDIAIFNGTVWNKIPGAGNNVLSIFGRTGNVVSASGDYTALQVGAIAIPDSDVTYETPKNVRDRINNQRLADSTNAVFTGGTITGIPVNGQSIVSTTVGDWIRKAYYPTQNPTSALTVTYSGTTSTGIQLEKMASGADLSVILNWTGGRLATTAALSSIVVGGVSQTFSQPLQPGTVSGTQASTVVRNTNKTFTNTVTTTDSKTASASASVQFFTYFYYGFVSSAITAPSDADIVGMTKFFNTSRTQSNKSITPSGSQKLVISFDASLDPGNISTIWSGGTDQTSAFTRTVRTFVNASGFSYSEIIYIQNAPTAAAITFQIQ